MFKKIFRGAKRIIKPFVNVSAWMNWQNLKENNQRIGALAKDVLSPSQHQNVQNETFEEAMARLTLSESAIAARMRYLKQLAILYTTLAAFVFLYGLYLLLVTKTWLGFITILVLTWAILTLAFKNHFWYIQMRERRLGIRFNEWLGYWIHGFRNGKSGS